MRRGALVVLAVAALAAVPAVTLADAQAAAKHKRVAKKARLKAFNSCAQIARYGRRYVRRGAGAGPGAPIGLPPAPVPLRSPGGLEGVPAPGAAPVADDQNSKTNVQEAGVGEPDVVKSQGSTIFAVAGNKIHAVDVSGAQPRVLGSLPVEGYGHQLLLRRNTLLVFSEYYGDMPLPAQVRIAPIGRSSTLITEIDVSNPAALTVAHTQEIPGAFVSARKNGASARVVIAAAPPAIYEERLRGRVSGWLPRTVIANPTTGARKTRRLTACRSVRRPATFFSGLDLLTVLTIDMDKGLPAVDSDGLMTGGEIVYASQRSLYVATQRWTPEPDSPQDQPPRSTTAIHKFDISERGSTTYRTSGSVPGYLLNQFALSERDGVLRVASTATPTWWDGGQRDESQSYVTTLHEQPAGLVQLGQVGGLGRGERIYAVRFIDDAAFVVTFRQVDPLYTLDLSKPSNPRVVGELKILGYSAYLHPLANDLLLGVGQDASEEGRLKGTQLSLFDVSDLTKPRRLHQLAIGSSSSSEAEYDHHAFLWWAPAKLAVLPLQSQAFVGAAGFHLARAGGIAEVGRTSHGDYPIRRALVVGGRLYTLSDQGLEANSLETLAEQAFLSLGS